MAKAKEKQNEQKPLPISLGDVKAAAGRIADGIVHTPQEKSIPLSRKLDLDIRLKFEIFQYTASFKDRGALNKMLSLDEDEKKRGVIANSAGNHAQGVAYHATRLGIPATIVMPKGTPFMKIRKTEDLGASVVVAGSNFSEAQARAEEIRTEKDLVFIHPFDDPLIMAGQGTVGLEFLERFPDLDIIVVPIGGGGLISGIATAAKAIKPDIRIIGVQTEIYPAMKAALEGREISPVKQTVAEGIAVKTPGKLTREVVRELVDDILIVREATIEHAINMLMEVEKVVVEGAGAAPLAALLDYPKVFRGAKVGLVLAGANIDSRILASSIMRGLVRDGRISRIKVTTEDLPGGLAHITRVVADAGANVIEVYHQREFAPISLKYTNIELVIETKDRPHTDRVIEALEADGFEVHRQMPLDL